MFEAQYVNNLFTLHILFSPSHIKFYIYLFFFSLYFQGYIYTFHFRREISLKKNGGKKYDERKEKKREKTIRGRIVTKSDTQGGKKIYFPPICTVLTLGKNTIFKGGGVGKNMIFWENINPCFQSNNPQYQHCEFSNFSKVLFN